MHEQITIQQKAQFHTRMFMSTLDEWSGTLKLFFILSTGAVVLLVPLVVAYHGPRLAQTFLALSILSFGIGSSSCLNLLMGLVNFRGLVTTALVTGMSELEVMDKLIAWDKEMKKQGKRVQVLLLAGMLFAALFVAMIVIMK